MTIPRRYSKAHSKAEGRSGSARAEQRHETALRDLHAGEALLQTGPEPLQIVPAIIENALGIVEIEQGPGRRVRGDAAPEYRGAEQHRARGHQRLQVIDRLKLLLHAARQAVQHIGQTHRIGGREIEGQWL